MIIEKVKISGIGGIKELELSFNPGFNAICGSNGIGKTTILKVIADSFSNSSETLKRNANYQKGRYTISYFDAKNVYHSKTLDVSEFEPQAHNMRFTNSDDNTLYIMNFRENRLIEYRGLDSIPRDEELNEYSVGHVLESGIEAKNIKGWFDNRCLFSAMKDSLNEIQLSNIELAKQSFSILDSTVSFKTVDSSSLDIILSSRNGDIYFEYLSAGYKSCVYLILGLIKEIEYRFSKGSLEARSFNGVILIDEIDLHLHPTWQARLVEAFKNLFPMAQFITTTHSPSILQVLKKDEIIPLTQDDSGNVFVKELNLTEYGLQGWSIEEILHYVMEMPETTSKLYEETKRGFDEAMDSDDVENIKKYYLILKQMLHPDSVVRRLIDIQIAGLGIKE